MGIYGYRSAYRARATAVTLDEVEAIVLSELNPNLEVQDRGGGKFAIIDPTPTSSPDLYQSGWIRDLTQLLKGRYVVGDFKPISKASRTENWTRRGSEHSTRYYVAGLQFKVTRIGEDDPILEDYSNHTQSYEAYIDEIGGWLTDEYDKMLADLITIEEMRPDTGVQRSLEYIIKKLEEQRKEIAVYIDYVDKEKQSRF